MSYNLAPIPLTVGVTSPVTIPGDLGSVSYVKLTNASPYLVQLTNILSGQDYLQPGEANVWPVPGLTTAIQATPLQFATAPSLVPVSSLVVTWYLAGEEPSGSYPVNFNLLSYTGNTLVSASEVINDGYASGTNVVEATPQGATASYILIRNDGTVDVQAVSNNVLTDILHVTPGTSGTPAQLVLQLLKTVGVISLDGGTITTNGAGQVTMTQSGGGGSVYTASMAAGNLHVELSNSSSLCAIIYNIAQSGGAPLPALALGDQPLIGAQPVMQIETTNGGGIWVTSVVNMASGNQEAGNVGGLFVAAAGGNSFGYYQSFRCSMSNVPTSITLTNTGGQANVSSVSATQITREGFVFIMNATAAGAGHWYGTYTTVGN